MTSEDMHPEASAVGSVLAKSYAHRLGKARGQVKCEKRNDNWPKVHKDPEDLSYLNDLTASCCTPPLENPTSFLSGCASLPWFCLNYTRRFSVSSPTGCCATSLIINCAPAFTVLALGTSLVVQLPQQGAHVRSLVGELISHLP